MNIVVSPVKLIEGSIYAPISKSEAHRLLICASLSDDKTTIFGSFLNKDIEATIDCLIKLGASIQKKEDCVIVGPIRKTNEKLISLNAGESGSTLRFIIPIAAMLNKNIQIDGKIGLKNRPIEEIINCLKDVGMSFDNKKLPLTMQGNIKKYSFKIDSSKSSQYLSGLLLSGGIVKEDVEIIVTSKIVSEDYVNITIDCMKKFGVNVVKDNNKFIVKGTYKTPKKIFCPGDYSGATYILILGAFGNVNVKNLDLLSKQGDKRILDILKNVGANVEIYKDEINVKKGTLKSFIFDADNNIDMVPALASLASLCEGETVIKNTDRLKIKESNRQEEIIKMLKLFRVKCDLINGDIYISKSEIISPEVINLPNDHRIAMAAIILATFANKPTKLINVECIDKSYPKFLEDYKTIGGKIDVLTI